MGPRARIIDANLKMKPAGLLATLANRRRSWLSFEGVEGGVPVPGDAFAGMTPCEPNARADERPT